MKKIKKHIIPLLIILLFSVFTWNFVYQKICEPKEYEQVVFFITGTVTNDDFEDIVKENLGVKEVTLQQVLTSNDYYAILLQTTGMITSDILIIKEDLLKEGNSYESFVEITNYVIDKYDLSNSLQYSVINEQKYGIVVYDKENNIDIFKGIITYEDDSRYVLVLNISSVNVSPYGYEDNITDNALKFISMLFGENVQD